MNPVPEVRTLVALELAARGIQWMPMGFRAAPVWWGRCLHVAANDPKAG